MSKGIFKFGDCEINKVEQAKINKAIVESATDVYENKIGPEGVELFITALIDARDKDMQSIFGEVTITDENKRL